MNTTGTGGDEKVMLSKNVNFCLACRLVKLKGRESHLCPPFYPSVLLFPFIILMVPLM